MTGQRPKDLVFTLFGEYLLGRHGGVWVGHLLALLEPFDLREGAVRTALSRMVRKGWLTAERSGRHAFYSLTDRGRRLLVEGQARIFHPTWDYAWNGEWVLLAYSIPEASRHLRDRLRDRLAWLGFGSLGNGLWISPHDVAARVLEVADHMEIPSHVECFRARRVGDEAVEELVAKCWDLAALNGTYEAFVQRWSPVLSRSRRQSAEGDLEPDHCYALRFRLIHEFRSFPLEDPYLPRPLLPADWHGDEATRVFHETHDLLVGAADVYVDRVLGTTPTGRRMSVGSRLGG